VRRDSLARIVFADRTALLVSSGPKRVEYDGYAEQQPARVARQLTEAAYLFANVLARLAPKDWERTVLYNYPTRLVRTLRWVAMHTLHEVQHHFLDARRQL
jgi:hypothetical protein